MKTKNIFLSLIGASFIISGSLNAQAVVDDPINSITAGELRSHIYFLASDFMGGRVTNTPEYEIAAQYVRTQFAAAGLEPAIKMEDGSMSYFQGVPFAKTVYNDKLEWSIRVNGKENTALHKEDFKIMFGSELNHKDLSLVWVGYGISEPDHKWDDLKDLDVEGKVIVCMTGLPMKKGKSILPDDVVENYSGERGLSNKIFRGLLRKGAAAIIVVDMDDAEESVFAATESRFTTEKTAYKGQSNSRRRGSFPSVYLVKSDFLNLIMADNKANPLSDPDKAFKNYQPQALPNVTLNSQIEILSEEIIPSNNVVGIVHGTDPVLKNEYIVVGAHLDHVRPRQGEICNGADDNASGSSGVMEIAQAVAMNPMKRSVIFITYTAEEIGLIGSRHFVASEAFPKEQLKFNLNMDMIGRSSTENEESRAHYVVTHKRYLSELNNYINDINDGVTDFPLLIDDDEHSPGGSDHQSFISEDIPAFFFFSGLHKDLHQPGDDADKIDYEKAEKISQLAYLITEKLANTEVVPTFLEK